MRSVSSATERRGRHQLRTLAEGARLGASRAGDVIIYLSSGWYHMATYGYFFKLGSMWAPIIRAPLGRVYIKAPEFWKLPNVAKPPLTPLRMELTETGIESSCWRML